MNSLWPTTSRISGLKSRTIFQTCHPTDSLATRLAHILNRTYSRSSVSCGQRSLSHLGRNPAQPIWRGPQALDRSRIFIRTFLSDRIVTRIDQVPGDYKDNVGLEFRDTPLSKEEAGTLFNNEVDVETANHILRVLHGRRVAGTLSDPSLTLQRADTQTVKRALAWLRKHVPVNEVESAGIRAEQELAAMEAKMVSDAERIGLYKRDSGDRRKGATGKQTYTPNSTPRKNVYGESGLDKIRKDNERKWAARDAAEAKRKEEAAQMAHKTGTLETLDAKSTVVLRRPGENPWLKHYIARSKFLPDQPPEMTSLDRIRFPALFTIAIIIASLLGVAVYTPPKNANRIFPDVPPSAATIIGIILANAAVFLAWRFPPAFRFLNKNFMFYPGVPRSVALLGAMFSHQSFFHLGANMAILWFMGVRLHDEIGRANFLAVYVSTGVFAGLASHVVWTLRKRLVSSHLGASGAICGIVACYLMLKPDEKIRLFGVFPPDDWPSISSMAFLGLLIGLDLLGARGKHNMIRVDHYNHLGGYAAGIGAAAWLERKRRRKREAEIERRKNMGFIDKIREGRI
jgi:rhomboid-like protein